jgi:hypothetical protein
LVVAAGLEARSIAFLLIFSGVYRRPKEAAVLLQALTALRAEPTAVEAVRPVFFDEQPGTMQGMSATSDYGR